MTATGAGPSARARLGSFEVDLRSGELRPLEAGSPASAVLLGEQPFQILRMLIERQGKIVTRGEIKKALWPNDTIVDFDHSINRAIRVLRRALGDSAATPRYVETLGRRGYRLLPAVEWALSAAANRPEETPSEEAGTSVPRDLIGKDVGHYRVLTMLGGGGMGMVYEAEDLKLGRRVALKFLSEDLATDPIALKRLEREARTASALNHPNICTIFDIAESGGHRFIVMELLEGETLSQRITTSAPLTLLSVIDIAIEICSGLQAAHDKAIVHRDIKPANIFLTRQGPVKLLDFGVAKLVARDDSPEVNDGHPGRGSSPVPQPGLTRTGAEVGTTGYISPEQTLGVPLDARSDLFSLGVVICEMATGRRAAGSEDPTPSGTAPSLRALPRGLEAVVRKALESDPARRYQTAAEMRSELERLRERTGKPQPKRRRLVLAGTVLATLLLSGGWLWLKRFPRTVTLAPADTLIVANVTNQTGDRVFDEALYIALHTALEQTPYVNLLGPHKTVAALRAMSRDANAQVTPELALEICRRTGSKMVVAPSISEVGNRFRLGVSAVECVSGATVAHVEQEATSRDGVIRALGLASTRLRGLLGEPPESIARFDSPLEAATSASPEALELLTLGYRRHLAGLAAEALPYYERAARADPDCALAHAAIANTRSSEGSAGLGAVSSRRAFDLRDRLTLPTRLSVESTYYREVTGELEQGCAVISEWVQTFPHDLRARNNFAVCLSELGNLDRALGEAREAARLLPSTWTYQEWMDRARRVDQLDEARRAYDEAIRRGLDSWWLREQRVVLAFVEKDVAAMQEQWRWAEGKPFESGFLAGRAHGEAYHGRFRFSRELMKRAASMATEDGAVFEIELRTALMHAEAGILRPPPDGTRARRLSTRVLEAVTKARTGRIDSARRDADALRRDFPSNTLVQGYGLPLIEAAMKLQSNEPGSAIEALRPAAKYELSTWSSVPPLYSAYLRGLALLRVGDGRGAGAEFRKLLAHRGFVERWPTGAVAWVQLARAQHLMGDDASAQASYAEFLSLWKDADEDLPLYVEAKAEYRKLQAR